jgi:hypothetical protein
MELTVPLAALSCGGADVGTLLDRFGEMQNAIACLREASNAALTAAKTFDGPSCKNAQREGSASLFPLYHYHDPT